jgi:sugar/nucleoside kinase (ribokinase family)
MLADDTRNVVIIGNLSYDSVVYPKSSWCFWGGGGLNVALAAGIVGVTTRLISAAGRDARSMLDSVGRYIDVHGVSIVNEDTCRFLIEYDENGEVVKTDANYGAANKLDLVISNHHFQRGHHHVCCRKPLTPQHVLERLAALDLPFSLDFVSTSAAENIRLVSRWMSLAKFVFVNRREFEILLGIRTIDDLQELIVTAGSNPVCVYKFGREVDRWDCPKKGFVEVTGAGDVFVGAYLGTRLVGGDTASSVKRAIVQAQCSINGCGVLEIIRELSASKEVPDNREDSNPKNNIA